MKVILISGKAGTGKDTTANIMKKYLKAHCKRVLVVHYGDLLKYICKSFFGWNGKKDAQGRELLQHVGTDIIRANKPNYWVNFIKDMLRFFPRKWDYVIIPDCRFPNEVDIMKAAFDATHVRVTREKPKRKLTPAQLEHASETALDTCTPDCVIVNNGSKKELKNLVNTLMKEFLA